MDKISEQRLKLLHPKVREQAKGIVMEANALIGPNVQIRVVQGLRTFIEQDAIYAQGRTKPGPIVTKAPAGSSYHNYGLALDFCLLINGKEISWDINRDFDNDHVPDWAEVKEVFKKYGWEWGGNFKTIKDYPHFQKTFGWTIKALLEKYNKKDFFTDAETGYTYVKI